jgi:hypothetical protein
LRGNEYGRCRVFGGKSGNGRAARDLAQAINGDCERTLIEHRAKKASILERQAAF